VFDFTPDISYTPQAEQIISGGTGYGLSNHLSQEVENIAPDYKLYPQYSEAYGFLTRGCPRHCGFCIVSEKEGAVSKHVADLDEFHQGQSCVKLLDPNILACADRDRLLEQLATSGACIDFTQGLDIRLVDKGVIQLLNRIKIKTLRFSWDNPNEDLTPFLKLVVAYSVIKSNRRRCVYVLTNYISTHEEDLMRVYVLRDLGFDPYIMIYDKPNAPRQTRRLQRWVNNKRLFWSCLDFANYK